MRSIVYLLILFIACGLLSCRQVVVNERIADIPAHEWQQNHAAVVDLDVAATAPYQLYFIFRHTEQYPYNNIVAKVTIKDTLNKVIAALTVNAPLASASGKWEGNAIDDLYDHFIKLNTIVPLRRGRYHFIITHQMKDDPLPFVLNAGIAIEKQK
ncbi:MAG: gliding motility lipoprotein GldH [Niabella sp.]|nr:gliding motility lipoprotein GldH [Niabella sp.]